MEFANYQLDWPRENLSVRCFVHDVFNYRYHWHEDEYELNILLHGRQECCRGSENFHLDVDDVILVPPGVGHASMGSQVDTIAFVLHFSASAFKPLLKKGGIYDFPSCRSDETTRDEPRYRHLRFYASQIFQFAQQGGPYAQLGVKASLELLLLALCTEFSPTLLNTMPEDEQRRAAIRRLLAYVSDHYAEKLTLDVLEQDVCDVVLHVVVLLLKNASAARFYSTVRRFAISFSVGVCYDLLALYLNQITPLL